MRITEYAAPYTPDEYALLLRDQARALAMTAVTYQMACDRRLALRPLPPKPRKRRAIHVKRRARK